MKRINNMKSCRLLLLCFLSIAAVSSCGKMDPAYRADLQAKKYLRDQYMDVYYYWNKEVRSRNAKLSPDGYDIYRFFNAMLYSKDRWSWMEDRDSYVSSSTGTYVGGTYAIKVTQAVEDFDDYRVWIRYIFPGSPLERYGVTRGAQLKAVADIDVSEGFSSQEKVDAFNRAVAVSPQTFTFRLVDGRDTTFTAIWATSFTTDYILKTAVFTNEDYPGLNEPVGYLNFISFNNNKVPELCRALRSLKEKGARKLILDLRYNGGGDSRASDTLVSFIAPKSAVGKTYVTRTHNDNLRGRGYDQSTEVKQNADNLGLDAIYFIMGSGSASASEMVYNGMRPLYAENVHHVGRVTYGKPNGMYVLMYPGDRSSHNAYDKGDYSKLEYVFYPISFYNVNSASQHIPDEGFTPENSGCDDIYNDFGPKERDIAACLHHIVHGYYPAEPATVNLRRRSEGGVIDKLLLPEEKTNSNYGSYKVQLSK